MTYRLVFIGVDKHADPNIRDLSGAVNDARALWALFADTFPNSESHLLTNNLATCAVVRRELEQALVGASPEDVAIIFFGGHGTRDHRLVLNDTKRSDLSGSTIAMEEIANLFRRANARATILILDCCFAGGVTARVIADSPMDRSFTNPLQEISGTGRLIISASKFNEPAYEIPGHEHGILTKALIDAFVAGEHTSALSLMNYVMERVCAEAVRIGVQQTPAFLGEIEGAIAVPRLTRGANYESFFPEIRSVFISGAIEELRAFDVPASVVDEWKSRFPNGLNELQINAVNLHGLFAGKSVTVIAPTSAGKTFIGEMAAVRAIVEGRKAVFLLPYRALVNEKFDQFARSYELPLGLRVIRCSGDYTDQVQGFTHGKYDLALFTYEMFLNLALSNPETLKQLGLVVLDEAQFITDLTRGIVVELILTLLLAARERGIEPQLIALSAVIGDANRFHDWLNTDVLRTDKRPVPLTEGVLDRDGIFTHSDLDGNASARTILDRREIVQRRDTPSAQDLLVPFIRSEVLQGRKVLVFRNIRGKTEGSASYLARDLGLASAEEAIQQLSELDGSTLSATLRKCLDGGTAFHNTNLTRDERQVVERAFRDPNSPLRVLVATTTVAAGINTPASTVVVAEQEFVGDDGRPFTVAEYKNMAGRAGRLGFSEQGNSVILATTRMEAQNLFKRYVQGKLEPLRSSFDDQSFDTWILRLLATVSRVPKTEVSRLLASTYAGYLAATHDPQWRIKTTERIEALLRRMLDLGLAEDDGGMVYLTPLGRACGRSPLSFRSVLRVIDVLRRVNFQLTDPVILVALVQILEEADAGYTPMFKRGTRESQWPSQATQVYGRVVVTQMQRYAEDDWAYWARCKRALVCQAWSNGEPMESIERGFTINSVQGKMAPGDVRGIADRTRWFLRSVHEIVTLMFPDSVSSFSEIELLARSLEIGIPRDALKLLDIGIPLQRGEYLALYKAGIHDTEQFKATDDSQVNKILSREVTRRIEHR